MGANSKQHYIPQSLLKMFTFQSNSLWQFSKSTNKITQRNVKNAAYQKHFYNAEVEGEDVDPLFFEKELCKIEDPAIEIIKKISKDNYKLSIGDKEILTLYLVLLELRTPAKRDEMSIMADKLLKPLFIKEMQREGKFDKQEADDVQNHFDIKLNNNGHLGNISVTMQELFQIYKNKHWTFSTCDKATSFIIADNPTILYAHPANLNKGGVIQEGSFKFFPLRSDLCLFMGDDIGAEYSFISLSKSEVKALNIDLMTHSKEYCYGKSDIQLDFITKKASLEAFSIEDKFKFTTLKTDKENEEILWGHLFYSIYLYEPIRQKINREKQGFMVK